MSPGKPPVKLKGGAQSKKPRSEHQGGTTQGPTDALGELGATVGTLKAAVNDLWARSIGQLALVRGELEGVRGQRDEALAQLAGKPTAAPAPTESSEVARLERLLVHHDARADKAEADLADARRDLAAGIGLAKHLEAERDDARRQLAESLASTEHYVTAALVLLEQALAEVERVALERDTAREALRAHRCHPDQVSG